jgi:hypothetical protein
MFFRFAWRLPAYQSVMRERVTVLAQDQAPAGDSSGPGPAARGGQDRVVPATKSALQAEAAFAGIFSFG